MVLDRPERRNAIDLELQTALGDALVAAATDEAVDAIVVAGRGPAFSAGGDLSRFDDADPRSFRWSSHDLTATIGLVERIEKPVVAAIGGVATGAGLQLARACDLRIASTDARFMWREGHLGLLPAHGGIARLVAMVGLGPARDLVLGGGDVDAARAHQLGLVTAVVDPAELESAVTEAVERILRRGAPAYAAAKRVLGIVVADVHRGQLAETLGQSLLVTTEEHRDRLDAARRRR